jgi:FkbM family methyltransferase
MPSVLRRIAQFVALKLPRIAYPILLGPLRGYRFVLGSLAGAGGGASVYFNQVEPDQSEALLGILKPGDIFFDIGANVGYYTLLASKRIGYKGLVYAFEPLVRNVYYLSRHVNLNHAANVVIIAAACADVLNIARFSFGQNTAEGHILTTSADIGSMSPEDRSLVPVVTVDAVSALLSIQPNVLKIDVEGAELAVLQGAQATLNSARPHLFLSVHSDELRKSCTTFLNGLGYRVKPLNRDVSVPTEFLAEPVAI